MSSKPGGIARHFTTRRSRGNLGPSRNASLSIRSKISGPVELIHTTNMLSYNAPDIHPQSASSTTTTSTKSDDDSDSTAPTIASSNASSPPTSPDIASADRNASPEPNHLSCYFTPPSSSIAPSKPSSVPVVPQRAPSHTKKNSEIMARQRSVSRFSDQSTHSSSTKASFQFSRSSSTSTSTSHSSVMSSHLVKPSTSSFISHPQPPLSYYKKDPSENPFGQELQKVTEIAEEFGVKDKLQAADEEERYMQENGLFKFRAEDYISEIQDLIAGLFADIRPAPAPMWI